MAALITAKNLAIGYGDAISERLTFDISEGDYVCIVGENGAGKSTLLKTILGFTKKMWGELNINLQKGEIGYLPQRTDIQKSFPATAREIVLSGRLGKIHKIFYSADDKKAADEWMEKMHIANLADRSFKSLSGGQQQRVLLARALVLPRKILILDEPITGLDSESRKSLYETIKDLHRQGLTVIMVTHDSEALKEYPTHILTVRHTGSTFKEVKSS